MRVFCTMPLPDERQAAIRAIDPRLELAVAAERGDEAGAQGAEVIYGFLTPGMFARAGDSLKWVQVGAAGVERSLFPEIIASDVVMTNISGAASAPLADHAFALLLAITRKLPEAFTAQQRREWQFLPAMELEGAAMGIIGMGNVGRQVAQRAPGFGMRVLGADLFPPETPPPGVERVVHIDDLHDMLRETDVLVMCAPHTPLTEHLLGAAELAALKEGAIFVNVSRGKTVDEPALIAALRAGKPSAAGLDVFEEEPLPDASPLWEMPNVIVTAHYATMSQGFRTRAFAMFLDNLRRYTRGEALFNVVDKQAGF